MNIPAVDTPAEENPVESAIEAEQSALAQYAPDMVSEPAMIDMQGGEIVSVRDVRPSDIRMEMDGLIAPDMVGEVIPDGTLTLADIQAIRDQGPEAVLGAPDYILPMEADSIEHEPVSVGPIAQDLIDSIDRWEAHTLKMADKFEALAKLGTVPSADAAEHARNHIQAAACFLRGAAYSAQG